MTGRACVWWVFAASAAGLIFSAAYAGAVPSIVIKNNHELSYNGPVVFHTSLPDGFYGGDRGTGRVSAGNARVVVDLAGQSEARLSRDRVRQTESLSQGALSVNVSSGGVELLWQRRVVGRVDFALVVVPGHKAEPAQAMLAFAPLDLKFAGDQEGMWTGRCLRSGYEVEISFMPYGGGWVDVNASVTRVEDAPDSAYIALVRRVTTAGIGKLQMRWNGRVIDGIDAPAEYDRLFNFVHGVDWCLWEADSLSLVGVNGFSAGFTYERKPGYWGLANHFYTWERAMHEGDSLYLISEIAGPNPEQEKTRYLGVRAYKPPLKGEAVRLRWRLAIAESPKPGWAESQFLAYAGYRHVTESDDRVTVDIGAPGVEFGTSYFPYSTMCENFDFYRTPGLDREGWWPFSPEMWENWTAFVPQMETDLRIIRSMGFGWVRLHHLELLGGMDRENAVAFLDYFMSACRKLELKVLVDTAGSPEWMSLIAGRYKDVVKQVELENEVLIGGIRPGSPERWTACYRAIKKVAPESQVFLTGACNQGMFDRLVRLGVPFDSVGFHNYKHGPAWKETNSSIAMAVAGHAADLHRPHVLGEFNWKKLTHLSPEARAKEFAEIYGRMLEPRAIPEFFQFHWQETLSVNPRLTRQGIRHYETINLDRRPKPESLEFMKLIRRYARADAPVRALPVKIEEVIFREGRGRAGFTIENKTGRQVSVELFVESYQGVQCRLSSGQSLTLEPGALASGEIELELRPDALPGTYHYFLKAKYSGRTAYGWGIASNIGAPRFSTRLALGDLVVYPQGSEMVERFDYARPVCVAFGRGAPVIEMEMAYQVFNTLQSATGQPIRLCGTADIPGDLMERGNLVLVGTPDTNPLITQAAPELPGGKGTVLLHELGGGPQWLLLTGDTTDSVRAAATDFVLRYWKNAKDSSIRVTGIEKGAAFGNKAARGDVNLP